MANESCIQKKKIRRVRLFELDACGRIKITGTPVLDWTGFESIKWANVIDDGTDETITDVTGETCVDDQACPIDRGRTLTFTECKDNWSLDALTGYGSIVLLAAAIVGFDRTKLAACPKLAAEILFDTPTLCDAGGNSQCLAWLIPEVKLWKDTAERTADGKTTVRGAYTARAVLPSGRLFELTGAGNLPPSELGYWTPWITQVAAGTGYDHIRLVDCPTIVPLETCDLRALTNV